MTGEASYYNYKKEDGTVLKDIAWSVYVLFLLLFSCFSSCFSVPLLLPLPLRILYTRNPPPALSSYVLRSDPSRSPGNPFGDFGGEICADRVWVITCRFYPKPKSGAEQVAQRVAFYVGKQGLKIGEPPVDAPKI